MDSSSFDRLVRFIAANGSRRGLLRSAFSAATAGLGVMAVLGSEQAEAKSCKAKCNKKKDSKAKKKCKQKCQKQTSTAPVGSKQAGELCGASGECVSPFICAQPTNAGNSDKKCCGPSGAPCGGDNGDLDDQPPLCCQGFVCSTNNVPNGGPGTCQPAP